VTPGAVIAAGAWLAFCLVVLAGLWLTSPDEDPDLDREHAEFVRSMERRRHDPWDGLADDFRAWSEQLDEIASLPEVRR
jgi:hypothetical protein